MLVRGVWLVHFYYPLFTCKNESDEVHAKIEENYLSYTLQDKRHGSDRKTGSTITIHNTGVTLCLKE